MIEKTWTLRRFPPEQEEQKELLRRRFDLPAVIAQLLVQRNIRNEEEADRFLHGTLRHLPDPFLLPDMDRAVMRLLEALKKKEKVLLFGDYDVDGITATAQLHLFLREVGLPTEVLLPTRMKEGYGLTEKALPKILAARPDLLVALDNGTKAKEEISNLRGHGIDVLVVDHHETPAGDLPPVAALLNPKRADSRFGEREIASAGLVFLLLMALRARLRERGISPLPNLKRYLDLACLGTVADVVPLIGTNRLLVRYGLEEIGATTRPGIRALMQVASVHLPVTVGATAFRLAPRLNAAGRLDDPRWALDLLLASEEGEALALALKLEALNRERQQIEEAVLREAESQFSGTPKGRKGVVVAGRRWHPGVLGIVAARLAERLGRPAVVLAIPEEGSEVSEVRGSARTVPGLSLYRTLQKIEGEMIRFGGHDAAAGLTLKAENLENFADKFEEALREEGFEVSPPPLFLDASLPLEEVKLPLIRGLRLLEPHGSGNPEPLFLSSPVRLETARIVGNNHLKATLRQEGTCLEAIGFDLGGYLERDPRKEDHRIAFFPEFHSWNGIETLRLRIKSIEPTC